MSNLQFDLTLKKRPADPTTREAEFSRGVQLTELMMRTGRIPGPQTLQALADMSDLPSRLAEGLKRDMAMAPMMPMQPGNPVSNQISAANGGHVSDSGGPGPTALNKGM